jgi:hypothetical protein
VVRQALSHELEREQGFGSLVERGVDFGPALRARADRAKAESPTRSSSTASTRTERHRPGLIFLIGCCDPIKLDVQ